MPARLKFRNTFVSSFYKELTFNVYFIIINLNLQTIWNADSAEKNRHETQQSLF